MIMIMDNTTCPNCGTATSLNAVLIESDKAFLPERSTETNQVFGKAIIRAITDDESPHYTSYGVFECQACNKRFVAKKTIYDHNWIPIYPIPHMIAGEDITEPIKSEFEEANLCLAIGAYKACAAMCQRTLESMWQSKESSGLNELRDKGIISETLFYRATEIRLWAGITKHKLIDEPVSKEDCEELIEYLDAILDHVYVEPKRFERRKEKRKEIEKHKT